MRTRVFLKTLGVLILTDSREEEKEDIGDEVTTRHCNRRGSRGGRTLQSVAELDAALEKAEDRLLEARDRQHNFVGYYL